jgi:hypothetical protein
MGFWFRRGVIFLLHVVTIRASFLGCQQTQSGCPSLCISSSLPWVTVKAREKIYYSTNPIDVWDHWRPQVEELAICRRKSILRQKKKKEWNPLASDRYLEFRALARRFNALVPCGRGVQFVDARVSSNLLSWVSNCVHLIPF